MQSKLIAFFNPYNGTGFLSAHALNIANDVYGELTELHEVRLSERGLYQWVLYP